MTTGLTILVYIALVLLIVVLIYALVFLIRHNRAMTKVDNLVTVFSDFAEQLIPAVMNIGTVTTAVHSLLEAIAKHEASHAKSSDKKEEGKK